MKNKIIEINKQFHDGSIRYDGDLDSIANKTNIEIAKIIAERHPFFDGNKRTAIKFMEIQTKERVPEFVYEILKKI